MDRRFLPMLAAVALFVVAVLCCDGGGFVRQALLGLATAGLLVLLARRAAVPPSEIVCAILIATLGEFLLGVGWGLYRYRFAMLPFYVPFGHGVFFTLAVWSARQRALWIHARSIARAVLAGGSVFALVSVVSLRDWWGLLWWLAAAALIARSRQPLLLSICCVYTMLMEWLGTSIGNWRWSSEVPLLGLHSANPPSGVGILYILLDVSTMAVCAWLFHPRGPAAVVALEELPAA